MVSSGRGTGSRAGRGRCSQGFPECATQIKTLPVPDALIHFLPPIKYDAFSGGVYFMGQSEKIHVSILSTSHQLPIMFPAWKQGARMHVVSRTPFDLAARRFPNQALALDDLYRVLKKENYPSPDQMRKRFPSLDRMKYREKWWVIDIGGGHLRVMFFADFERGRIFIKHISTHAEYDKLTDVYRRTKE